MEPAGRQELISAHLDGSKWTKASSKVTVTTIINTQCITIGDALRDMDSRDVISGDFVLVAGDVVSNLDLRPVIAEHKRRREADKGAIMTSVYKKVAPSHRTRSLNDDVIVGLNTETSEVVYFSSEVESSKIDLDVRLFTEVPKLELRHDLLDTFIDICAPEVLMLFSDNFDYSDLRSDFVRGILGAEILGNKVFAHIVSSHYAARIQCLKTYAAVSLDVVHRWTFPLVPDSNFMNSSLYRHARHNVYREQGVTLARSSVVGGDTVIGRGTCIAEGASVEGCIIGRNCVIGKGVKLVGCYIWDSVTIEADVTVESSIIASGAVLRAGAVVSPGSIVSYNVVIGAGHVVPPSTKITTAAPSSSFDDASSFASDSGELASSPLASSPHAAAFLARSSPSRASAVPSSLHADVGAGGVGRVYDDPCQDSSLVLRRHIATVHDLDDESDSESTASDDSLDDGNYDPHSHFMREMVATMDRGATENHEVENVAVEIASLKLAFDRTVADVSTAILVWLLGAVDAKDPINSTKAMLGKWSPLLRKFQGDLSRDDETDLCISFQDYAMAHPEFMAVSHIPLQLLYEDDILSRNAILAWADLVKEEGDDVAILDHADRFLTWLRENNDEYEYDSYEEYE
ncbi:translation initiation factor eIF-2B subunit epsilon [Thecamonas trahens ATCC 50062]|uniref:Translation initiation factor eIF2B subunit epsilon n=1 Tax=Thecamonas trahens ATCC 50062 TaxID=461836 RepID=A0A0L0DC10_THETB|nr:translation initiation factor eIF-2B subunit epsilon [Thecamonas trahens ATCC 50062]KNC49884.1 translation initiation factor eIF-2B subunit epsilon [Thecamonas trahens ATCC 50062]|eukprot:XP_013757366.1 translation initiation factor eIF-2B subunit epsilon [Thecamonas trahens ATCC 50062]